MEKIDVFDDYLKNRLDDDQKLAFEKDLSQNELLKMAFDNYKVAIESIKFHGLQEEIRKAHRSYSKTSKKSIYVPVFRAAAVMLFGLISVGTFWTYKTNGEDLLTESAIQYIEPNHRGGTEDRQEAEKLYLRKEYASVIKLYNMAVEQDEKLVFLVAMAHFNLNEYQKTLEIADKASPTGPHANEYSFYKCQSLIGLKKYDEALMAIEEMEENSPYKEVFSWEYRTKLKLLALKERFFEVKTK
ncbi:MAG TPA: CDC27 family protein [Leadbetterella sp.]|nr:CDC27 family protein [Leadbetterella sp.]